MMQLCKASTFASLHLNGVIIQAQSFFCAPLDLQGSNGMAEDGVALQTAKHSMLQAEQPPTAERRYESPLQPLEAVSRFGSSGTLDREEQQVPVADPDEAAHAEAEPQEEGQNTPEARMLYLQQDINRLVSRQNAEGAAYPCDCGKARSDPGLASCSQLKVQAYCSAI